MCADAGVLGPRLDVPQVPQAAMARARRRAVAAAAARPAGWLSRTAKFAAALAAVVVLTVVLARIGQPPADRAIALPEADAETLVLAMQLDPESQILVESVDDLAALEAQLGSGVAAAGAEVEPIDRQINQLHDAFDTLMDDPMTEPWNEG